jgi:hypothetical protein
MNKDYSEQLKLQSKLVELEENLELVGQQLKETQMYLLKVAEYQANLAKKVSSWPYIAVEK